jgi:hypothetical protein
MDQFSVIASEAGSCNVTVKVDDSPSTREIELTEGVADPIVFEASDEI